MLLTGCGACAGSRRPAGVGERLFLSSFLGFVLSCSFKLATHSHLGSHFSMTLAYLSQSSIFEPPQRTIAARQAVEREKEKAKKKKRGFFGRRKKPTSEEEEDDGELDDLQLDDDAATDDPNGLADLLEDGDTTEGDDCKHQEVGAELAGHSLVSPSSGSSSSGCAGSNFDQPQQQQQENQEQP